MESDTHHDPQSNPQDAEVSNEIVKDAIQMALNDMSVIPTINIVRSDIEQIHHEDTYQAYRLNKDINNIDIRILMSLIEASETHLTPLTTAIIRNMATPIHNIRVRFDNGANRFITPHRGLLFDITQIPSMTIDGVGGTITVSEIGYMKLKVMDDSFITVKTYFCNDAPETIVSPTDVCVSTHNHFTAWEQYSDTTTGSGHLKFYSKTGLGTATLNLSMINGLWYTKQNINEIKNWSSTPTIRRMTIKAEYELWHQRLGRAGEKVMANLHKCVDGVPELSPTKHPFRKCTCCMKGKIKAATKIKLSQQPPPWEDNNFTWISDLSGVAHLKLPKIKDRLLQAETDITIT